MDNERFQPFQTEDLRYGLRVCVYLIPSVPEMCTPRALEVVGPAAFHYQDVVYKPIGGVKPQVSEIHNSSI